MKKHVFQQRLRQQEEEEGGCVLHNVAVKGKPAAEMPEEKRKVRNSNPSPERKKASLFIRDPLQLKIHVRSYELSGSTRCMLGKLRSEN